MTIKEISTKESANIALFIDIENLVISSLEIALPVDLNKIITKLLEYGRISIRRGFGDLDMACRKDWPLRGDVRRKMQENLIQFEDIPYITKHKNTADMRLTVEALSTAYNYPDIDYFAIVAADRDYVPLIAKLRELGKRIIGIGPSPDTVNEIYIRSCDIFLYYSSMFYLATGFAEQVPGRNDSQLLKEYLMLLRQAVDALVLKGFKPVGAAVAPLIRQLRPDFDPKLVNLRSFRELVSLAEEDKLVEVTPHGGDILIHPPKNLEISGEPLPIQNASLGFDSSTGRQLYRRFFEEKMKCLIPSMHTRAAYYDQAASILKDRAEEPLELGILSEEIKNKVGLETSDTAVFKVMYALFRANAFDVELGIQPYNPRIKSVIEPREKWDKLFIKNCLVVLKRERCAWPLMEEELAEVFEVAVEEIRKIIEESEE